jgi:superfamily II DNA or RNA helicase
MSSPLSGIAKIQADLGIRLFDHQIAAMVGIESQPGHPRACLYHKTGAGKSITALGGVWLAGYNMALVIAPPSTHSQWHEVAGKMCMKIETISHAKFRQAGFKLDRKTPVIADEFHQFGGHDGVGWKKLDRLAGGLQAPLILASATPNYNDAERVYCIQHILDPQGTRGGYLEFLYKHCNTRQNPFSKHRIMASGMETRHRQRYMDIVQGGTLRPEVARVLRRIMQTSNRVLFFCAHAEIAEVLDLWLDTTSHEIITGKTPRKWKDAVIEQFKTGQIKYLVGTATLATGTDGFDKVCDTLVLVDDTDDDALRRQLIGRILPRGADSSLSHSKQIYRLEFH